MQHQQRTLPQRSKNPARKNSAALKSASRVDRRMTSQSATSQPPPSYTEPRKRVTIGESNDMPSGFEQQHQRKSQSYLASDKAETEFMSIEHVGSEHPSWNELQLMGKHRKIPAGSKLYSLNKDMCKEHAFCVPDHLEERIPIEVKVAYPLPYTTNTNDYMNIPAGEKHFLNRVAQKTFGETGAQRPGTKTVLDQYSLDHYLAQQWNLDIENMPYTMPDQMAAVQKRFMSYSRKSVSQVKINQSAKPTLQKKFNEWEKAKLEQQQRQLELLYFRSNQDPKVLTLLQQFQEKHPHIMGNQKLKRAAASEQQQEAAQTSQKQGKRTDLSEFRLEALDMVPMVYTDTMKVDPLIVQLQREHEDVAKIHAANPYSRFGDCAQKYYDKMEKQEKEAFKKQMRSMRSLGDQEKSNYLPSCLAVKKRMDSEHLNSWLVRSEIQYSAERRIEFQKLLAKASPKQLQEYRKWTKESQKRERPGSVNKRTAASQEPINEASNEYEMTFQGVAQQDDKEDKGSKEDSTSIEMGKHEVQRSVRPISTCASTTVRKRTNSNPVNKRQRLFSAMKNQQDAMVDLDPEYSNDYEKFENRLELSSMKKVIEPMLETMVIDVQDRKENNYSQVFTSTNALRRSANSLQGHKRISSTRVNDYLGGAFTPQTDESQEKGRACSYKVIASTGNTSRGEIQLKSELTTRVPRKIGSNYNTRGVNFGNKNKSMYSTKLPSRRPIYSDLIDAQEGKGRVADMFKSARWQKDKNLLIASMNHHMQRHRPHVQLTGEQDKKRIELAGRAIEGNQRLQQHLTVKFGMEGMQAVPMPPECVQFLKEPSELLASKKRLDEQMRSERDKKLNACTRAMLQTKAFETLNRSTQPSETSKYALNQHHHRGSNSMDNSRRDAPRDPKPDIFSMTTTRLESFNKSLTKKVTLKNSSRPTWKQRRMENNTGMAKNERMKEESPPKQSKTIQTGSRQNTQRSQPPQQSAVKQSSQQTPLQTTRMSSVRGKSETHQSVRTKNEFDPQDITTFEAKSPGIGAKARGSVLKKLTQEILRALDHEIIDTKYESHPAQLSMPDIKHDQLWLNKHFKDMDGPDFWQQKGLLCSKEGKSDAAMDYYRQGLRKNPTDESLLYSLALSYLQMKKFESAMRWFSYGIELNPRWVDGLCGVSMSYFNMRNFEKALTYIDLAKNNFKTTANKLPVPEALPAGQGALTQFELPYASQINLTKITLIKSICLKETQRLDLAHYAYVSLEESIAQKRAQDLIGMVWGCILVPLSNDRRLTDNHFKNVRDLLLHFRDEPIPKMDHENLLLSRFCVGAFRDKKGFLGSKLHFRDYNQPPALLNYAAYKRSIRTLIQTKSFFKRFNSLTNKDDLQMFEDVMKRSEVELYRKDMPVFLNGRVAVVTMGSCEVRCHTEHNLMKPIVLKKAIEGDVVGAPFNEDAQQVLSPLTWLIAIQDFTEVVYFSHDDFHKLWNLHRRFTEHQLVIFKLNMNKFFRTLNKTTKMHLVFECLDLKNFYPGELLLSVHARSPLSNAYDLLFRDNKSKFREEIDNRIMKQLEKHASAYVGFIEALNQPSEEQVPPKNDRQGSINVAKDTMVQIGGAKVPIASEDDGKSIDQEDVDNTASLVSLHRMNQTSRSSMRSNRRLSLRRDDINDEDMQSDSTDYGVAYCHEVILAKKKILIEDAKGLMTPTYESEESLVRDEKFIAFEIEEVKEGELDRQTMNLQKVAPQTNPAKNANNPCLNVNKKKSRQTLKNQPDPNSLQKLNKRMSSEVLLQKTIEMVVPPAVAQVKIGMFNRAQTMARLPINQKRLSKLSNMAGSSLLSSIIENSDKKQQALEQEDSDEKESDLGDLPQPRRLSEDNVTNLKDDRQAVDPVSKNSHVEVQYNFLFQRYINLIEKNDRKTKLEFRRRKKQIKYFIGFIEGLKQHFVIQKVVSDQQELDKCLKEYRQLFKAGKVELPKDLIPEGTSGFWNSLLIEKMRASIERILLTVVHIESANEVILKFLVLEIDRKYAKLVDTEGIQFIAAGDAFVIGPNGHQNMKLHTNDCFGQTDFVKTPGPEFLGDVRAGLMPVQTYFLSFENLQKRISIAEKLRLYQMASQDERMDGIMKFVARRDGIKDPEKMKHY